MLTKEELLSLHPGDVIEAGPLFTGLGKEPLVLEMAHRAATHTGNVVRTVFNASWHGIAMGDVIASFIEGEEKVTWLFP